MRLICLLPILAAGVAGQQPAIRNPRNTPADIAAGARIFRSHCADCHGLKGEGGKGPNLTTGIFFHGSSDLELFNNITDGIPGTPMLGVFFSDNQVWQLVAYVRSLSQRPAGQIRVVSVAGENLFREKGCSGCHLVRGQGGEKGPDLSVIGSQRSAEHLREAILNPDAVIAREYRTFKVTHKNGTAYSGFLMNEDTYHVQLHDTAKGLVTVARRDIRKLDIDPHSSMPSFKGKLSDSEVNDLVAWLSTLQRERSQ
jgi:putative heme-binding domain-containing protein